MRKPLVAGNWKMNNPVESPQILLQNIVYKAELLHSILKKTDTAPDVDIAIFPPSVYLKDTQEVLTGTGLHWGAQNVSAYDKGAYTGEISASMLVGLGCEYVLIGHSERRCLYEKLELDQHVLDQIVAEKYAQAINEKLTPIICIGETLEDYEAGKTEEIIARLLDLLIEHWGAKSLEQVVLAYEPVWAIGTGKSATPEWAQEVHAFMRQRVASHDPKTADSLRILYGGSVKPDNAASIFAMPDVDGGLIGGASLAVEDFMHICFAAAVKNSKIAPKDLLQTAAT
ncbi:triose-phosphate isomerase [Methylophaga sp. OBS4]|uniref:triose-phosphate isomerase n=1 Tax=Methylophaga sp. OBS4 TaxID=2991935 RepID=UPI0022592134|nr:triose-phosphate isomerase [Methylophaga sp. OBS4]MCX4187032.1 triose-phosphate isomerase [Methylophaga sp. OBS4]